MCKTVILPKNTHFIYSSFSSEFLKNKICFVEYQLRLQTTIGYRGTPASRVLFWSDAKKRDSNGHIDYFPRGGRGSLDLFVEDKTVDIEISSCLFYIVQLFPSDKRPVIFEKTPVETTTIYHENSQSVPWYITIICYNANGSILPNELTSFKTFFLKRMLQNFKNYFKYTCLDFY